MMRVFELRGMARSFIRPGDAFWIDIHTHVVVDCIADDGVYSEEELEEHHMYEEIFEQEIIDMYIVLDSL